MKTISGVSPRALRTDHARPSKAIDQGLCELGGGRNPLNLISANTNQRHTYMRICCFGAQSVGTRGKKNERFTFCGG